MDSLLGHNLLYDPGPEFAFSQEWVRTMCRTREPLHLKGSKSSSSLVLSPPHCPALPLPNAWDAK
jgi:hypothetical protein